MIKYKNRLANIVGLFYRMVKYKIRSGDFKRSRGRALSKAYVMCSHNNNVNYPALMVICLQDGTL